MSQTGIRLHYSNRTERLLDALIENLEARRLAGASLFDAPTLVVPNRNVETYVKFGIARGTGIVANLRVLFLRPFLGQLLAQARPGTRIVDGELLYSLVLSLLYDDALLAEPDLRPVRDYLHAVPGQAAASDVLGDATGDATGDAVDLRRCQLASQVARFFEEYSYSRGDMLDAWPTRRVLSADFAETETWQRRLWLALFAPGGLVEARAAAAGQSWQTAARLYSRLGSDELRQIGMAGEIHLFGISYVARAYQMIFGSLARAARLSIYTVNPCMEFWEDVETDRERMRRTLPRRAERCGAERLATEDDPFRVSDESDTPALRLWGRPGRENIRLLNELTACEFEARFEDPTDEGATLLSRLQRDILLREPARERPDPALSLVGDASLRVLACPGVRREAETIAGEIWRLVKEDEDARLAIPAAERRPPLRFNEIAVILPSSRREEYQAHLAAVLRETWNIPHNIIDIAVAGESRVAEAIGLLLALPFGRFTRQEVLRLVTHPSVMGRFGDARPERWLAFCESLGIVHGADHAEHAETYIERDVLNWDQGLRRLALGAFMTGRKSGDERMLALGPDLYLPEEPQGGDGDSVAGFGSLVRSLIADARFCRTRQLPIAGWIDLLQKMVSSYISADSDEDERSLERVMRAIRGLEEMDLGGRAVSFRVPYERVTASLASASTGRGQHLADGVVLSSFQPMRAIPFRVIFVAGLGEHDFPSVERSNRLDLRTARRRPGDVSPREQDKYMFLETLLCARERLYLSYVSRDALTGDALEPSSVIRELMHMLDRGYLGEQGSERLVCEAPLRRFDDSYFPSLSGTPTVAERAAESAAHLAPEARREAQARALGRDLRRHLGARSEGRPLPDLATLEQALPPRTWDLISRRLGLCGAPLPVAVEGAVETVSLSMSRLRRFFECPMQGSAGVRLGLREDDDDTESLAREDELWETGMFERIGLLRGAFVDVIARAPSSVPAASPGAAEADSASLASAWDERALRLELDGKMPTGMFGAVERQGQLAVLDEWLGVLREWTGPRIGPVTTYRLGRAEVHAVVDELLDPVVLDEIALPGGRRVRVEITGQTQPVVRAASGSLVLMSPGDRRDRIKLQKNAFRGFLDHVVLAAAHKSAQEGHSALVAAAGGSGAFGYTEHFDAIDPDEARAWLAEIAAELLGEVHDYLLPCEAVFAHRAQPGSSIATLVEQLRDGRGSFSSDYGPVPRPRSYAPPDEARAAALIERRFGLYDRVRRVGEAS